VWADVIRRDWSYRGNAPRNVPRGICLARLSPGP